MRSDERRNDELRPVSIKRNYMKFPSGSVLIEIQGTVEETSFSRSQLEAMIELASKGIRELFPIQKEVLSIDHQS